MLIGYARVSTQDQTLNLQRDALEQIGCKKIFTDTASGAKGERKGLEEALAYIRDEDTPIVRLSTLSKQNISSTETSPLYSTPLIIILATWGYLAVQAALPVYSFVSSFLVDVFPH